MNGGRKLIRSNAYNQTEFYRSNITVGVCTISSVDILTKIKRESEREREKKHRMDIMRIESVYSKISCTKTPLQFGQIFVNMQFAVAIQKATRYNNNYRHCYILCILV